MTQITLQDGKIVLRDGKVGTEQACCCGGCCGRVVWHRVYGECNNLPDDFVVADVGADCYAYYTFEDWDCQNALVGRDCGAGDQCNIYARVKVAGDTPGVIEYLQSEDPDVWGASAPGGFCDCPDSFGSLSVQCTCPPESDCCGTAEYLLDFCEEVDGQWVISGTNDPCECAAGFTQTELIEQEPFPGAGFNVRILRCFIRDCDAVGEECCVAAPPEDCLGPDGWPGDRFENVNAGPGGAFQFFEIGCADPENPLP